MAYKDTDFMYASARVSVFETRLLTREKYMQLIDAASEKDAVSLLGDACAPVYTDGAFYLLKEGVSLKANAEDISALAALFGADIGDIDLG